MVIRIPAFGGMVPRLSKRLLPDHGASDAVNCQLRSREARPYNGLLTVNSPTKVGTIKSIYLFGTSTQYWFHWTEDVDVVRGPIAGDTTERTYYTGTDAPRVTDATLANTGAGTDYPKDSYLLGIPIPAAAAVAALGAGGTGTARAIAYVYTYVSAWGEEGPPAAASNIVSAMPGQTVNVSGISATPAGDYNITAKRIYRVNTGTTGQAYQLVAEIAVATTTYADSKLDADLGAVIPSTTWVAPPSTMKGLTALPGGVFAGFTGNELCFSEPYQPHAWPVAYRKTTDYPIVGLGAFGNAVVVATNANPYIAYGSHPSAMQLSKVAEVHGCVSKRGIVSIANGVIFPTSGGMVFINNATAAQKLTEPLMTQAEWQGYKPDTLVAAVHDGRVFAWYETGVVNGVMTGGGFIINPADLGDGLVKLGFLARAAHADPETGKLYVLVDSDGTNRIQQWEGSTSKMDLDWRSRTFVLPEPVNMGYARVDAEFSQNLSTSELAACNSERTTTIAANQTLINNSDVLGAIGDFAIGEAEVAGDNLTAPPNCDPSQTAIFKLYSSNLVGAMVERVSKTISSSRVFALPAGYASREFEVRVSGQIPIKGIVVAESEQEVMNG